MKVVDGVIPLTSLNSACRRFLDERRENDAERQQRQDALTMVHTVMVFGDAFQQTKQRRRAWFHSTARREEPPRSVSFRANADGLVEFRNRMDLPLPVVWKAAIALYGEEAVSPLEGDGFTILLPPIAPS